MVTFTFCLFFRCVRFGLHRFFFFILLFCQWCQGMWMLSSLGRGLGWLFFFLSFFANRIIIWWNTQTHASTDQFQLTTGRASVEQKGAQFSREACLLVSTPPTYKRSFLPSPKTAWVVVFFYPPLRHRRDAADMFGTHRGHCSECHWEIYTSHPARRLLVRLCFNRKNWHNL